MLQLPLVALLCLPLRWRLLEDLEPVNRSFVRREQRCLKMPALRKRQRHQRFYLQTMQSNKSAVLKPISELLVYLNLLISWLVSTIQRTPNESSGRSRVSRKRSLKMTPSRNSGKRKLTALEARSKNSKARPLKTSRR